MSNPGSSPNKVACIRNLDDARKHLEKARDCAVIADDPFLAGAIAILVKTVFGAAEEYNAYWETGLKFEVEGVDDK